MLPTRFRWTVTGPFESKVAVSPRKASTLPTMRTVRLVNCSRYAALIRGVASLAMMQMGCCGAIGVYGLDVQVWIMYL